MPRDEKFEYLPNPGRVRYLASCVEPRLDGLVFPSSQTGGHGRNIVLFNHARLVESYDRPEDVKLFTRWGGKRG